MVFLSHPITVYGAEQIFCILKVMSIILPNLKELKVLRLKGVNVLVPLPKVC